MQIALGLRPIGLTCRFYIAGSPVLFFFTGSHSDYHTATDDADKINAIACADRRDRGDATSRWPASAADLRQAPPRSRWAAICRRRGASLGTARRYDEDPSRPKGLVLSMSFRWARGARRAQGR